MGEMGGQLLGDRTTLFEGLCRRKGLKLTHQRLQIYGELVSRFDHPSAEEVFQAVQIGMPTIALDTVYRTLLTFEALGLISRVPAFEDRARFDANLTPHQHFACTRCKAIEDFQWEAFENMPLPSAETQAWGEVQTRNVIVKGVCRKCK